MRLKDKVAVITGGGSGLGRETAFLFTEQGAKVVVLERVPERAKNVEAEVREAGGELIALTGDVGNEADVERAVQTAIDEYGGLDIMFANAGHQSLSFGTTAIEDVTDEEWQDVLSTNLTGVVWSVKYAVRAMKASGNGGSIVITGSASTYRAFPTSTLYSTTKGGVNSLAIVLSREVGPYGIRVNVLNPLQGMSPNFMMPRDAPVVGKSYEEAAGADFAGRDGAAPLYLGRPPTLRDNANAVLFLASDESGHMTGQQFVTNDGGITANIAMQFSDDWVEQLVKHTS